MVLPTLVTSIRGTDSQGSGHFGASRDGGKRTHNGVDIVYQVAAVSAGKVSKIGYPYDPVKHPDKAHFRYVRVTDEAGYFVRYLYVDPTVKVGDAVIRGQGLGYPQDLTVIYPGITPHIHFDVKNPQGSFIDPLGYLEDL